MLLIENISERKLYINDLRILLQPKEALDLDKNEVFIKNNFHSNDLESLTNSGKITVIATDKKEETEDMRGILKSIIGEVLSEMSSSPRVENFKPMHNQASIGCEIDTGEINARIHGHRQKQEVLKNSRISIDKADTEEDANTDELVELLRKQKEGAKNV